MAAVLPLTDALEAELPTMLQQHQTIRSAVDELRNVARAYGQTERARLAEKILLHARTEEQVTYPAAVLVGRMVREGLNRFQS
jgi:hypothetical protein